MRHQRVSTVVPYPCIAIRYYSEDTAFTSIKRNYYSADTESVACSRGCFA